jgi:excisionase family DNA binding protein
MKIQLEQEDIQAISKAIIDERNLILANNGRHKNDDNTVFDVKDLSKYLKVSHKWIYERTHLKEIPHKKRKGLVRFRKKDIDKWLESHNVPVVDTPDNILKVIKQ